MLVGSVTEKSGATLRASQSAQQADAGNFSQTLQAAAPATHAAAADPHYTVRPGDALTRIVREQLLARGKSATPGAIYDGVRAIARENNLRDPDALQVGQRLSMTALGAAPAAAASPPPLQQSAVAKAAPQPPAMQPNNTAPASPTVVENTESRPRVVHSRNGKWIRHIPRNEGNQSRHLAAFEQNENSPFILVPRDFPPGVGGPASAAKAGMTLADYRKPGHLVTALRRIVRGESTPATPAPEAKTTATADGGLAVLRVPARVSSGYGMRRDPFTSRPAFHLGVDLAVKFGTDIYPMRDGVVKYSGWQSGYGRIVIVQHADGLETVYAHNSANLVRPGDVVSKDSPIARVGSSGRSTGPHLHFEVRRNGAAIDPTPWLQRGA